MLLACSLAALAGEPPAAVSSSAHVVNPATGASLAVYVDAPQGSGPFPALVAVPGGTSAGGEEISEGARRRFAAAGVVLVRFDPDGRGQSGGTEDFQGARQQAGVRAVIDWAVAQPYIQDDRVGVMSSSAGLLMAAPALAGGPHHARFLLDWEGPPTQAWLTGCLPGAGGIEWRRRCDDTAFWSERSALLALPRIGVPYWRVQGMPDHKDFTDHQMVYMALDAAASGHLPWVRINDAPPTSIAYSHATIDAALLPKFTGPTRFDTVTRYALEAFRALTP